MIATREEYRQKYKIVKERFLSFVEDTKEYSLDSQSFRNKAHSWVLSSISCAYTGFVKTLAGANMPPSDYQRVLDEGLLDLSGFLGYDNHLERIWQTVQKAKNLPPESEELALCIHAHCIQCIQSDWGNNCQFIFRKVEQDLPSLEDYTKWYNAVHGLGGQ